MIGSTFDLSAAIAVAVMMPLIVGWNYFNRQAGITGYIWREVPNLARVGLVFLSLVWLGAVQSLLTHYGLLSAESDNMLSMLLALPMFVLSMVILVWGGAVLIRFLKGRGTPDSTV